MRIDAHESETDGVFPFGLFEPAERVLEIVEQRVDDRDLVGGNPVLITLADDLVENGLSFVSFADGPASHVW